MPTATVAALRDKRIWNMIAALGLLVTAASIFFALWLGVFQAPLFSGLYGLSATVLAMMHLCVGEHRAAGRAGLACFARVVVALLSIGFAISVVAVAFGAYGAPPLAATIAGFLLVPVSLAACSFGHDRFDSVRGICWAMLLLVGGASLFFSVAIIELALEIPTLLPLHFSAPAQVHFFNILLAYLIVTMTMTIAFYCLLALISSLRPRAVPGD